MKNARKILGKALGMLCALALLITALYVPMTFSVGAVPALSVNSDETVVFDFEEALRDGTVNKETAAAEGVGYYGWAVGSKDIGGGNFAFYSNDTSSNTWLTKGGYRLNKKDGDSYSVYSLEPSSDYVVSLDIRVLTGSKKIAGAENNHTSAIRLGYGATASSSSNYVSAMEKILKYVVTSKQDSTTYTITTDEGTAEYVYGEEWHTVAYSFTTPADLGAGDKSLMLWAEQYPGFNCQIDNVSVTKLGADTGVVVFNDEYSGECYVKFGKIGEKCEMVDVSGNAAQQDHSFEGWCIDAQRKTSVSEVSFTENKQVLYSKWVSPVTITFKNTLNNTETKISGMAGDSFKYPADPTDPSGKEWFMGWYTTEGYTEEHISGIYGFSDITLYSLWKASVPGLTQNFENYNKDTYTVTESNGNKKRSNAAYFGPGLTKQSEVTYGNSGYAIKLDWDAEMVIDPQNEKTYNAAGRYFHNQDNLIWLGNGIEDNQNYIAKVKVNVEKADADLRLAVMSAGDTNGWQSPTVSSSVTVSKSQAGNGWIEVEIPFTTNFADKKWGTTMYLCYTPKSNADIVAYFDDVVIEAVAQPYESLVTIQPNTGDDLIHIKGKRGDTISLPEIKHPDGAQFLGYYTDAAFGNEFNGGTYQRGTTYLYVKWGKSAMTFRNYPYADSGKSFGKTMSVVNEKGVGINDDYALRFLFDGDSVWSEEDGKIIYTNSRAPQQDHVATIGTVTAGKLYNLSFYYRTGDNCQTGYTIQLTYGADNIWQAEARKTLDGTVNKPDGTPTDWQKVELTFIADQPRPTYGNNLYVQFFSTDSSLNSYVEAYVDDVMLEEVTGDIIYFNGNSETANNTYIVGKAGDTFTVPSDFKNGRATLLGLYLDPECKTEFTATTIPAGLTQVYAKWSIAPITFEETYPNGLYGRYVSIVNEPGIGIDDDYALRFTLDADTINSYNQDGTPVYAASRFDKLEHVGVVGKVENGVIYRVSFSYRALSKNNVNVNIRFVSGDKDNIWQQSVYTPYNATTVQTVNGESEWKTTTAYITANVPDVGWTKGDTLYIQFTMANSSMDNYADAIVDNVLIERIYPPYVFFDAQNGAATELRQGAAGEEIKFPETPKRHGFTFTGWYLDAENTKPFTDKEYVEGKGITVYGGWKANDSVTYDFENYGVLPNKQSGKTLLGDSEYITTSKAHSGNGVIVFDRTKEYNMGGSFAAVAADGQLFKFDKSKSYIVTVHYYIVKRSTASFGLQVMVGSENNYWDGFTDISGAAATVWPTEEVGIWKNVSFVINSENMKDGKNAFFIRLGGGDKGIYYIDDITVTTIPKGKTAIAVNKDGCDSIPTVVIGNKDGSFSSKLPASPARKGKYFRGYYTLNASGSFEKIELDNMKFKETPYIVYAKYIDLGVTQSFEDDYIEEASAYSGISIYDYDYEIYDSKAEGNSASNVTHGRYSLHRKGTTPYFESAVVLTNFKAIADDQRYTVTFKVKMGEHAHTDGAVIIASGRSPSYAWTTQGSEYAAIAIADLADGNWHEVTYTYNSVDRYFVVKTPGYVELFMDEFEFSLVTDKNSTPVSTPVTYTEYIPAFRDKDGNIINAEKGVDISTIVDASLYEKAFNPVWIIVPAAAVVLIAAAVVLILLLKRRKKKI